MLIFPEPRRVSDSGSCVSYADRRWLVLPAEAGFELKEAAMCAAELLSERFFSPVEVTAGTPGAGARLLTMVRDRRCCRPPATPGFTTDCSLSGSCCRSRAGFR